MFISKEELDRRLNQTGPNPRKPHSTQSTPLPQVKVPPVQNSNSPITSCVSSLVDKDDKNSNPDRSNPLQSTPIHSTKINRAMESALEKTLQSLGMITPDKLIGLSAKDLATIASKTSKVIDNCRPDKDSNLQSNISITIYSPEQKSEDHYRVIDVSR
jgi:hypothetical protein